MVPEGAITVVGVGVAIVGDAVGRDMSVGVGVFVATGVGERGGTVGDGTTIVDTDADSVPGLGRAVGQPNRRPNASTVNTGQIRRFKKEKGAPPPLDPCRFTVPSMAEPRGMPCDGRLGGQPRIRPLARRRSVGPEIGR